MAPHTSFDLDHLFTYHAPQPDQVARYKAINDAAKEFARVVIENTPTSADQSTAIRKIREARMDANAAIATGGRMHVLPAPSSPTAATPA